VAGFYTDLTGGPLRSEELTSRIECLGSLSSPRFSSAKSADRKLLIDRRRHRDIRADGRSSRVQLSSDVRLKLIVDLVYFRPFWGATRAVAGGYKLHISRRIQVERSRGPPGAQWSGQGFAKTWAELG
jgi:hypothetical protein